MQNRDAVFLEDLCPKLRVRRWRQSLHTFTDKSCIYCGNPSESIDHVLPRSRGGLSVTENCVPSCLSCNGHKSNTDAFEWYRQQNSYDPRRAMAIRAWMDGDLSLAERLLEWAQPNPRLQEKVSKYDSDQNWKLITAQKALPNSTSNSRIMFFTN